MRLILILVAVLSTMTTASVASEVVFPADAGVYNVREHGAKGDGATDDTAALQEALDATKTHMRTVYLPNGTYLISDTLQFHAWRFIQGQSRDKTIIKLKDRCDGYQNPSRPKYVLDTTDKGRAKDNVAFSHHVLNLTIDTGIGNPAAIGIRWISHNGGGLEDVLIRGDGPVGMDVRHTWDGPNLNRRLTVQGFKVGVWLANDTYSTTFEDLTLEGQQEAGLINDDHPTTIRRLTSRNHVPAVIVRKGKAYYGPQTIVLDAVLAGGDADQPAIRNDPGCGLYVRNLRTAGYGRSIHYQGGDLTEKSVAEFFSHPQDILAPFGGARATLNLPVRDTPAVPWPAHDQWISPLTFNPPKKTVRLWDINHDNSYDLTEALQRAIDSGKPVVYLPYGIYHVTRPIVIRGKMQVLQGCGSVLVAVGLAMAGQALLRFEDGEADTVFLDRLSFAESLTKGHVAKVEHAASRTLVVLHSRWMSYRSVPSPSNKPLGDLIVDDMCGSPWQFTQPQRVYLRSLNMEQEGVPFRNDAATVWVLGVKTERPATVFHNTGPKATTELLGGLIYPVDKGDTPRMKSIPVFRNDGGTMSLMHAMFWANHTYIVDTQNGREHVQGKNHGPRFMHLYRSQPSEGPTPHP